MGTRQDLWRMSLGGAACGGVLGMFGAACLGAVAAALFGNWELPLDAALIGAGVLSAGGAAYGWLRGLTDDGPDEMTAADTGGITSAVRRQQSYPS